MNGIFHRNRTNNPKVCMESQKILNSQKEVVVLKKEQSRRESYFLISDYTTKL